MNRAIFSAIKPGALSVIVDASARQGSGISDAQTLHRIEQSVVQGEVTQAGFTLVASADFCATRATRGTGTAARNRVSEPRTDSS